MILLLPVSNWNLSIQVRKDLNENSRNRFKHRIVPLFIHKPFFCLDEVDKYYKCQEWKVPVANTVVFVKDDEQNFHYRMDSKDNAYTEAPYYASAYTGDSGSGVVRQMEIQGPTLADNKKKSVLLAVISKGSQFKNMVENPRPSGVCKFLNTKVTDEFITWMKEQDRKHQKRGI